MVTSVRDRLTGALAGASKADKVIASYMLSTLATIPFETAASLALKVNVSEPTVGRFCRTLGFSSFKDIKEHLKEDIGDSPWLVSDRLLDFRKRSKSSENQLARGLELEMAALVTVYEHAQTLEWDRVVKRLAQKTSVYAAGFQTERGMAQIFVNQLQYLRDKVHLLDLAGGNFAEILATKEDICLVIFEARPYSRMARQLANAARECGFPVTLITDVYCDWGQDAADEVFAVPTDFNLFWNSTAHMASLGNLLINSVFIELGHKAEHRMNRVTELYGSFTGHVGAPVKHQAFGQKK